MDCNDYIGLVFYYGRARFYHSMQKSSLDGLAKYPMQSVFRLYNGISLALGNRLQEAIRELNPMKNDSDLGLGTLIALIYSHKRCSIIDKDALYALEKRLHDEKIHANAIANYYAGVFMFFSDKVDKAREYSEKALRLDGQLDDAIILKAWCDLSNKYINGNLQQTLDDVLSRFNGKHVDASLCLVRYYQLRGQFESAIIILNKLSVRFPELSIPLILKMEIQFSALDYDHTLETAMRIVNLDMNNVAALRVKAILLIGMESNFKAAGATLQQLLNAVERVEVGNHILILQICQLFSRVCSRNELILQHTVRYMTKINQLNPGNADFLTELGYELLMVNKEQEAVDCFRSVLKIDENNFNGLCGLILSKWNNQWKKCSETKEQYRQQLEFLNELDDNNRDPLLLYINALFDQQSDIAVNLLIEATERHLKQLDSLPFSCDYLCQLNPDFLLQLITEFLRHSPVQVHFKVGFHFKHETIHITLKHSISILETVIRVFPSHIQSLYMLSKVEFICGKESSAIQKLQRIINDIDETYTEAYLLLSQLYLQQHQLPKALQSLELALSHNFSVRDQPMYHFLLGLIQRQKQQLTEAQQSFVTALHILGTENVVGKERSFKHSVDPVNTFTLSDKVTLYLELIKTLREVGDTQSIYESERLLQIAMDEFGNTTESGRLIIAHSEFMLQNCNVSKAINLLSAITPNQSYYIQAKTCLANVYLQQRNDRIAFSKCFQELVQARPEPESYLMMGEAYMSIQEPELAVDAYQKAVDMNPQDLLLACKLGRAHVKTHQYVKAIKYYHEAAQNPEHSALKLDLAELYLKLKQFKNAAKTLSEDLDHLKVDQLNTSELQFRTKQLLLLARIHEKSGNISQSLQTLREARENQYRIHKRFSVDQPANHEQYEILSKICFLLAQQSVTIRDNDQAVKYFKEAIKHTPNDIKVLKALARLYLQMNSMDLCEEVCSKILQEDTNNEASVMMADLSFRKMEFDNAAYHFSQLLILQPCYWTALARLIEVMRRSGTLTEAVPFLQRAEQSTINPYDSPGFNYCKGLYEWYSGNPNEALRHFNNARRDYEWGQQAIFNMIEICINPDGDIPSTTDSYDTNESGEVNDSRLIAIRTAERLLKELRHCTAGIDNQTVNYRLLRNFLQIATKQKFQIENALQDLTELAQKEEYQQMVGPVFGMASALVMLKQIPRAKNHLKRVSRFTWNYEESEYLERSWLLLADIYIHSNKLEVAESLVDRVLEHNKSSSKAYELAGYIAEKSQSYRDAIKHYYNAWNCGGQSKPHIGYKLAYNHMKVKSYAEALNVCYQVIKLHPDYNVIRKDILDKCRNNLRP